MFKKVLFPFFREISSGHPVVSFYHFDLFWSELLIFKHVSFGLVAIHCGQSRSIFVVGAVFGQMSCSAMFHLDDLVLILFGQSW